MGMTVTMRKMRVPFAPVKGMPTHPPNQQDAEDRALFARFVELLPGGLDHDQGVAAGMVGIARGHYSKLVGRYRDGEPLGVGPKVRAGLRRAIKQLEERDPIAEARAAGILEAVDAIQKELDRLREVAMGSLSAEDVSRLAARARRAARNRGGGKG